MSVEGRKRPLLIPNRNRLSAVPQLRGAHGQQVLPQLDISTPIFTNWKLLTEAISIFLTNNNKTVSFYGALSKALLDADSCFTEFHQNFSRVLTSRKRSSYSDNHSTLPSTEHFLKAFGELKTVISQISQNGTKVIQETVESSFTQITDTFDIIKQSAKDVASNDPIIKRITTLTLILNPIKKAVLDILHRTESAASQGRLTTELRNYSRTINSAFRQEFSALNLNASEMETLRTNAYNACSDIIYGMKAVAVFDDNMFHVRKCLSKFDGILEHELGSSSDFSPKSNQENAKTSMGKIIQPFNINEYNKLSSLLAKTMNYIKNGGNNKQFLQEAMKKGLKMSEELEKKADSVDLNHISILEKQLSDIKETMKKGNNDMMLHELKGCLFESIEEMKAKLNKPEIHLKGEEDIVPTFNSLFRELSDRGNNDNNDDFSKKLMELLNVREKGAIIDCVKEKLSLIDFYQKESEKYNNDLTKKIHERICIISSQMDIRISESDVETLDKISDYFSDYQDKVRKSENSICSSISSIFGFDDTSKANLSETMQRMEQWYKNNENLLKFTENHLKTFLSVQKTDNKLEDSIRGLLSILENTSSQNSYRELNAIYNRIQSLNQERGEATVLNAGSDYYSQINSMINTVSEQVYSLSKTKRTLEHEQEESKNTTLLLHSKMAKNLGVFSNEEAYASLTLPDLLKAISDLFDETKARQESFVSDDFIRDAFGAQKSDDARSVIMDRASRQQIIDFSLRSLQPFSAILEKALAASDIGSSYWKDQMRDCSISLSETLNKTASSKINSTIFLILSRFVSLISTLIPTASSARLPMFCK